MQIHQTKLHQESEKEFPEMTTIGMSPFSRLEVVRQGIPRPERREIIILRKGPKPQPPPLEPMVQLVPTVKEEPNDGASPVALPTSGGRRKRAMASSSNRRDGQQPPPLAVARRNARERNRVKQVNNGFANLRQHIPAAISAAYAAASGADLRSGGINGGGGGGARKLSKVETLRMAVDYIRRLQQLLAEADGVEMPTAVSGSRNNSGADSPQVLIDDDDDESMAGLDTSSPEPQHSVEAGYPDTPEGASNSSLLNFVGGSSPQRQNEQYFSLTSPSRQTFPAPAPSPTRQQHISESCIVPSALSVEELATSSHFKQQDLSSRLPAVERTILLTPEEKAEAQEHSGLAYDVATLVSATGGSTSGLLRPQLLSRSHLQQLSGFDAAGGSPLCDDGLDASSSATSTFLRAHQLAASLVAQGYHYTLQMPPAPHPTVLKKEPGDSSDVMDVIGSWWDHEQKMRQQTAT